MHNYDFTPVLHYDLDTFCVTGGCQTSKKKVDMVFGSALDGTDRSSGNVGNVIRNLASQLEDGSLFGLVRSHGQHVHAHLFDGQ